MAFELQFAKNYKVVVLPLIALLIVIIVHPNIEPVEKTTASVAQDISFHNVDNNSVQVMAGGGNATVQYMAYFPPEVSVNIGQTVTWYNPSGVPEPHTVTFFKDNSEWGNIESSLVVGTNYTNALGTQDRAAGSQKVLNYFSGALEPKVVKADDTIERLPANASYTVTGNEDYINSGWIWPAGQALEGLANINEFSLRFEKAGTYEYLCLLHPWMVGKIIVK